MLNTFIYKDAVAPLWYWYVLNGSHVLDQGTAKTQKTAESKSATSKAYLTYALTGEFT